MRSLISLLSDCAEYGITLRPDGTGGLDVDGPEYYVTDEFLEHLRANKSELLKVLTGSRDDAQLGEWCRRYHHPIGWRGHYDEVRCLTCCEPLPSAVRNLLLRDRWFGILNFDPWTTPISDESRAMLTTLEAELRPIWREFAPKASILRFHAVQLSKQQIS